MGFAEDLKRMRIKRGYTQRQLAEQAGISCAQLNKYEKGLLQPKSAVISKLATALNEDFDSFFDKIEHNNTLHNSKKAEPKEDHLDIDKIIGKIYQFDEKKKKLLSHYITLLDDL